VTWKARVDPASSYPYYENQATGQTQWADPRSQPDEAEVADEAAEPEVVEVVEVAEAPAAAPEAAAPAEAPAPAPKKHTPTRDWARKPLFSITNSVEATG